jgi:hypothetical protein
MWIPNNGAQQKQIPAPYVKKLIIPVMRSLCGDALSGSNHAFGPGIELKLKHSKVAIYIKLDVHKNTVISMPIQFAT